MSGLKGRAVLVVGASSGMGRATAIALSRGGADVAFAARRRSELDAAVREAGGGLAVPIDVTDPSDIARAVDETVSHFGRLDGILYTAGMSPLAQLRDLTPAQWQQIYAVNTFGPNLVIAAARPHLADDAVVGVVSSDSAAQPRHSLVAYASSKVAMEATLEGWRTEETGGKRFVTISIGPTQPTSFADSYEPEAMMALIPHWQRQGFRTGMLAAEEMGLHLAQTYDMLFSHPGYGVEHLLLRAPEPSIIDTTFGIAEAMSDRHSGEV